MKNMGGVFLFFRFYNEKETQNGYKRQFNFDLHIDFIDDDDDDSTFTKSYSSSASS